LSYGRLWVNDTHDTWAIKPEAPLEISLCKGVGNANDRLGTLWRAKNVLLAARQAIKYNTISPANRLVA
jgi:hypothetical protein